MMKMGKKALLVACGCMLLLSGCTKSNIVQPDASQAEEPDFNVYNNIELDMDQFHDEVNEICLDENDYPMADSLDFTIDEDKALIDVTIVVKDGTSGKDAAEYADAVLKSINDEAAVQDYSYGESGEDTFGGFFQDRETHLKIYEKSAYESDGKPMYETNIPADTYMTFDIEK